MHTCCSYLPLELLNNDTKHLDKADIFSLGCTLYELSTGQVRHIKHMRTAVKFAAWCSLVLVPELTLGFVSRRKQMHSACTAGVDRAWRASRAGNVGGVVLC